MARNQHKGTVGSPKVTEYKHFLLSGSTFIVIVIFIFFFVLLICFFGWCSTVSGTDILIRAVSWVALI